jgi:membrane associated rhomboid family serine protease
MIVPWLKGFLNWEKAPVTWMFILLNIFIFLATWESQRPSAQEFSNPDALVMTGKLYLQYKDPALRELPLLSRGEWMVQGGLGLKDPEFTEHAGTHLFFGDQLEIQRWRETVRRYLEQVQGKWSYIFGLRTQWASPVTWVTYQFMHAGWMHLFGNMMMLLLFGAAVEVTVGSLGFGLLALFSGFAGALLFLILSPLSLAPMIGASGSLSGVMAFYAAFEKKKRVPFFYFVSPMPGYFGWIHLPTLIIFPLCFLSDLVGYLSTAPEIGAGVAYTAHIGGALFGALLGFGLRYWRKNIWVQWFFQH